MTGIFLLNRTRLGFILTPVILTFFVLMDITIGALDIIMNMKGIESNLAITAIMSVIALASFAMLIWYLKSIKTIIVN